MKPFSELQGYLNFTSIYDMNPEGKIRIGDLTCSCAVCLKRRTVTNDKIQPVPSSVSTINISIFKKRTSICFKMRFLYLRLICDFNLKAFFLIWVPYGICVTQNMALTSLVPIDHGRTTTIRQQIRLSGRAGEDWPISDMGTLSLLAMRSENPVQISCSWRED